MSGSKAGGQRYDIPMRNHRILEELKQGHSVEDVADSFGLTVGHIAHIARESGHLPKHERPKDGSFSERDQFITARAMEGETFTDIARDYGLTRERVRQIVKKREGIGAKDGLAEGRAARRRENAINHAKELIQTDRQATPSEIANLTGITADEVRSLMDPSDRIRRTRPKSYSHEVPDSHVLTELRRVSQLPGGSPLATDFYDANRAPGSLTAGRVLQRHGSWRNACLSAGVCVNDAPRSDYARKWKIEDLLGWVSKYLDTTDRPTYNGMAEWLRQQPHAPSAQTVRNYVGTWTTVLHRTVEFEELGARPTLT